MNLSKKLDKSRAPTNSEHLLKTYKLRSTDALRSFNENFLEILKVVQIDGSDTHNRQQQQQVGRQLDFEQSQADVLVRCATLVRSCENLLRLISDIKEYLIINDYDSPSRHIAETQHGVGQRLKSVQEHLHAQRVLLAQDANCIDQQLMQNNVV